MRLVLRQKKKCIPLIIRYISELFIINNYIFVYFNKYIINSLHEALLNYGSIIVEGKWPSSCGHPMQQSISYDPSKQYCETWWLLEHIFKEFVISLLTWSLIGSLQSPTESSTIWKWKVTFKKTRLYSHKLIIRGPIYIYAYDLPVSFHIKFSTNIFVIYKSIISFIFSVSAHCSWSLLLKNSQYFSFHYIYWDF